MFIVRMFVKSSYFLEQIITPCMSVQKICAVPCRVAFVGGCDLPSRDVCVDRCSCSTLSPVPKCKKHWFIKNISEICLHLRREWYNCTPQKHMCSVLLLGVVYFIGAWNPPPNRTTTTSLLLLMSSTCHACALHAACRRMQ